MCPAAYELSAILWSKGMATGNSMESANSVKLCIGDEPVSPITSALNSKFDRRHRTKASCEAVMDFQE